MKKYTTFIVVMLNSQLAIGLGGETALLAQLVEQTSTMAEQLKESKDMVDISKKLEEMESLKAVKQISTEGSALQKIIRNASDIQGLLTDWENDPVGTQRTEQEIEFLERAIGRAQAGNGTEQQARAVANIMADMERIKFLGQANEASQVKLGTGTNEQDNNTITATNAAITADILIEEDREETAKKGHEVNALHDLFNGVTYSSMVGENE